MRCEDACGPVYARCKYVSTKSSAFSGWCAVWQGLAFFVARAPLSRLAGDFPPPPPPPPPFFFGFFKQCSLWLHPATARDLRLMNVTHMTSMAGCDATASGSIGDLLYSGVGSDVCKLLIRPFGVVLVTTTFVANGDGVEHIDCSRRCTGPTHAYNTANLKSEGKTCSFVCSAPTHRDTRHESAVLHFRCSQRQQACPRSSSRRR